MDERTVAILAILALIVLGILVGMLVAWVMDWQRKREGK